jgi:hypothetical protein
MTTGMDDTWDAMRARTWDGPEDMSIYTLMGSLGVFGKPVPQQRDALKAWLAGPASIPAPPRLRAEVQSFLL